MAIDLMTFSATKYKETIYQIRLTSYLAKYEDFEESDFIEKEIKLFWDCLNAVDFFAYRQNMEDYHYLKHEVGEGAVSGLYPRQNSQVLDYIDKNSGEEKRLQKAFSLIISFLNEKEKLLTNDQTEQIKIKDQAETVQQAYIPKPCFNPELIDRITKELNTFFEPSQHGELKRIIETGSSANVKLLFRDNGNKLTDYFRELFNNNTITGCTKTVLINWIIDSFKYTYRRSIKDYDFKTVEKTVSSKDRLCKNPII
jgi:hypothetical protein